MLEVMTERTSVGARPETSETQLSADGGWWWNGADWVRAASADGLWRWEGKRWMPALEFDRDDPTSVVDAIDRLVDDRFARGGQLLALRAHEWRPRTDELAGLVAQAAPLAARLSAVDAQLAGAEPASVRSSLRGLLRGRDQLEAEGQRIEQELRPLAALIGRTAPQPSLKDADEILVPAQRLHERLVELQTAATELRRLRAEHQQRVGDARADLEQAGAEREVALGGQEASLREREAEHQEAVAQLSTALRELRMPGLGEPRNRFQGVVVYDRQVETPDGRGPIEGARAVIGSAAELAESEREAIAELWLLETAYAVELHDALAAGSEQRFLLVLTPRVSSVVPIPAGAEPDADAFAASLEESVNKGRRSRRRWQEQVSSAEGAVEAALADTSAVDEVRAELERAREDPKLSAPVKAAERRLRDAERPTAALTAAEQKVKGLIDTILQPPEELRPAAAS